MSALDFQLLLNPDPEIIARAIGGWDRYAAGIGHHVPDAIERTAIRAHLVTAGVLEHELDWMAQSCPSLLTARRLYPTKETYAQP